jgi:hypothetical protein
VKLKVLVTAAALTGAAVLSTVPAQAADTFPSQDACGVVNNNTPVGNCGPFTQLWKDNFNDEDVAVGKFSNCAGDHDHRCEGLAGTRYYDTVGAYPSGWDDTAGSGADGNNGPVPGVYRPESTISVAHVNGDGVMRVKMYRPSTGGSNRVAAVVPRKCMNLRYGKFTERLIVRGPIQQGYKMAHLRYTPNEIDYPEAGGNFSDPIYEYTHGFGESSGQAAPASAWTSGHTYSTEITPGKIKFFFDGKLFKTVNADFPDSADWILQNESALGDSIGAAPGSSVIIDTSWATCYKYSSTLAKSLSKK